MAQGLATTDLLLKTAPTSAWFRTHAHAHARVDTDMRINLINLQDAIYVTLT